jgi:serine/threonine protein kinase
MPYVDPKIFNVENHPYNLTKKSDIYSLGVIFWELTSCKSPFNFDKTKNDPSIMLKILNGERENPILNTNSKFVELYQSKYNYKDFIIIIIITI